MAPGRAKNKPGKTKLCYHCGAKGHLLQDCPSKPPTLRRTPMPPPTPTPPAPTALRPPAPITLRPSAPTIPLCHASLPWGTPLCSGLPQTGADDIVVHCPQQLVVTHLANYNPQPVAYDSQPYRGNPGSNRVTGWVKRPDATAPVITEKTPQHRTLQPTRSALRGKVRQSQKQARVT